MKNRNNIARYMNSVNKSGYHKDLKKESYSNKKPSILQGLEELNNEDFNQLSEFENDSTTDFTEQSERN